jgi:hypothetical protein
MKMKPKLFFLPVMMGIKKQGMMIKLFALLSLFLSTEILGSVNTAHQP